MYCLWPKKSWPATRQHGKGQPARRRVVLQVEPLEGRVLPSTIVLSPSKDNTLYQSTTVQLSNGAGGSFFAGRAGLMSGGAIRRGVIAFDVSSIPAGSTINSVTLRLNMSQTMAGAENVELRRLLADWGEGTSVALGGGGGGAPATVNDATWLYRFFDTVTWTNPGGDFVTTASASTSVGFTGAYTWGSTPQMVADVQGWLNSPTSNFGWLVLGDETVDGSAKRFDSKENPIPDNRPTLTIDYTSTTTASTLLLSGFPSSVTAGVAGTETVTAKDASGRTATDYRGTVHFTSSDPQAVQPADYTFTAADAGVHSFSVTLKTAGTQSITATDVAPSSITGTQSGITVSPAAVDHLRVSTPGSAMAGTPFDVGVTAQDLYNNTVTNYGGTVTFTSSDAGATLPGNYTFTAADNGMHGFPSGATLLHAGSQTITATDTTTPSVAGTSTVTISAAALDHFSITSAGTVAAGMPFDLIVTAQDRYGNTVTGYVGTVTFTTSDQDPQVSLPPDYTFTSADNGTHTFSGGATLFTMGNQTITVTLDNTIFGVLTVTL
jgi:hypothetical protein